MQPPGKINLFWSVLSKHTIMEVGIISFRSCLVFPRWKSATDQRFFIFLVKF